MTEQDATPFKKKVYYALTLDPVHIGTGGYRLGRVDNTITREPGTNLPKIPGSSIAGATRAYTAMAVQSKNPIRMKYQRERAVEITKDDGTKEPQIAYDSCAGKGGEGGDSHCGEPDCEVCVPFGFSRKSGSSFQGLAQFYDARILFFPVHSMIGPVWITCPSTLKDFCDILKSINITIEVEDRLDKDEDDLIQTALVNANEHLNLGWLLLKNKDKVNPIKTPIPSLFPEILNKAVLVPDKLFSRIVNDNLEVRTSVAIDPATGAAEHGALYTYEAIPRATIMWFDVVYNRPEYFRVNGDKPIALTKPDNYVDPLRNTGIDDQIGYMAFNVQKGLKYLETLGVGGMNTRGMGRVRILNMGGPE